MLNFVRITYLWLTIVLGLSAALAFLVADKKPDVQSSIPLTTNDIERAKRILDGTFSGKRKKGLVNAVELTARDLNVASNYLLKRYANGAASVELNKNEIRWRASLKFPRNPLGKFINVRFRLTTVDKNPVIHDLSIGSIQIAQEFAGELVRTLIQYSALGDFHTLAGNHIKNMEVGNEHLNITYRWNPYAAKQIKAFFSDSIVSEDLLLIYHNRLVDIARKPEMKKYISLSSLMEPLFKMARQRSEKQNPIQENRALLLVLGAYVNGKDLKPLISEAQHIAGPRKHYVMLNKRIDTAQHFMTSAVLALSSGTDLANIVGLYKEITDSKVGSGFSFIDLAADYAGTRFGDFAVKSPEHARAVQAAMGYALSERIYMPKFSDLPESLDESSFKQEFGTTDSPAYRKMIRKIEQRISDLDLYQHARLKKLSGSLGFHAQVDKPAKLDSLAKTGSTEL